MFQSIQGMKEPTGKASGFRMFQSVQGMKEPTGKASGFQWVQDVSISSRREGTHWQGQWVPVGSGCFNQFRKQLENEFERVSSFTF
jgi:hypothetical protein